MGQDCSSPSGSSLSCTDRPCSDTCYSPKLPEGQSRACVERNISQGVGSNGKARDDVSLRQRLSKRARQDPGRTLDLQLHRGLILEGQISHSAPPSRDSTLKRTKVQAGVTFRPQKDLVHMIIQSEGRGGQEGRSHDSLLSFFKPGFMKKGILRSPTKGIDRRANGHGHPEKLAGSPLAKLSLSNGTLSTVAHEDGRTGLVPGCDTHNCKVQLLNGKAGHPEAVDIQRAHSSSNIQTKLDLTFRRCASLQRNGEVASHPEQRILLADKPGHAPLQRTRYSTTSLGRHRPVPEH